MKRSAGTFTIEALLGMFPALEFPQYQREPDVWTRDQKQRLLDSVLRDFDISTVYFYRKEDGVLECIDGRQRLNAIVSFFNRNLSDQRDNGFPLKSHNEVSGHDEFTFVKLHNKSYEELQGLAKHKGSDDPPELADLAAGAIDALLNYEISAIYLEGVAEPEEFNLQFLRLNLGTLINSGEKLHAMVGNMRDLIFKSERIGKHPFFQHVRIPTRRYAAQQVAAQALIQVFHRYHHGAFTRARHIDLQRFLKAEAQVAEDDGATLQMEETLNALERMMGPVAERLRNRAITVTVVVYAWSIGVRTDEALLNELVGFVPVFLDRLQDQVDRMRKLEPDRSRQYLIDFQRHVTQASVERPAVEQRHRIFDEQFEHWRLHGKLEGDS